MTAFERAFFSAPTTRRFESRRCRLKACSTQRLRTIHTHLKQSTPIIQSTRMLNKMRTLLLITLLCAVAAAQVRYEDARRARTGRAGRQYRDVRGKDKKTNRGAAILGERVYFTTSDNYLTALDRQTGVVIFSRKFADAERGVGSTSAPFIAKDKVIVGSAGGDSGMRGFVAALSAETGEEMWRTYTVPAKGEPGAESWGDFIEWGGGATWLSGTFDPELNTLYWTTGNPWPDFTGKPRQGDNLYTCSLVALDLDTGKMKWYFQFTPHDTHDWDAQSWPVLIDMEWKGTMRKIVLHANRNGFFYLLDRTSGEFLRAT